MFRKHTDHQKRGGNSFVSLCRLLISLIIFGVLAVGLYQAYKSFSGVDILTLNPKGMMKSYFESEAAARLVSDILTFNPGLISRDIKTLLEEEGAEDGLNTEPVPSSSPLMFKFAVLADPHLDTVNLSKALQQAKNSGVKLIIGIGDFSDVGTMEELRAAKLQFDAAGLPYYVIPGDHDLWDSRNKKLAPLTNFKEVFGVSYKSFSYNQVRFILLDNSDNYLGVDKLQFKWIDDELLRAKAEAPKLTLAFSSIPLYHPSSDHIMGKEEAKLRGQAEHLLAALKKNGVAELFAADIHFFSRYTDPVNNLKMTTVGAVTSVRNPQAPRFVMVDVYQDGGYNVMDTEVR